MTREPPALDERGLRNAFGAFATGVTVVTARGPDGRARGLTVNSFASVSLSPPLVLWSLAKLSPNLAAFRAASHFAVNVLTEDQEWVARQFARSQVDRFRNIPTQEGRGGAPILRQALATFECRNVGAHEGGDHMILVGEVEDYTLNGGAPLIFHGSRFTALRR